MKPRAFIILVAPVMALMTSLACALPTAIPAVATATSALVPPGPAPSLTSSPVPTETLVPSATPTPTETATSTQTPTQTARPRTSIDASFLKDPPDIDGSWSEWTTTQYPMRSVVFGESHWDGEDDLRASYRVGWDEKYLYLAVKVFDDEYVQNATGANLFKGDSIEVLLSTDPDADREGAGLTSHNYQVGISPGNPKLGKDTEAYLWYPASKAGSLSKVEVEAIPMEGGYRIEMAIPWSTFGVTPKRGLTLGFSLSVSDNDDPDKNTQQSILSSASERTLDDPTTWGTLTLK
jgi:hypothetical protein